MPNDECHEVVGSKIVIFLIEKVKWLKI